jgi:hypothetical protein
MARFMLFIVFGVTAALTLAFGLEFSLDSGRLSWIGGDAAEAVTAEVMIVMLSVLSVFRGVEFFFLLDDFFIRH